MKCTNLLFWIYFCHGVTHSCLGGVRDPEPYKPISCWRMENHVFQNYYYSVSVYMLLPDQTSLHSVALPMLSNQKKIQKFDTQENISQCQALGQCQWVRKVRRQWVSDESAEKGKRLINKHHSLLTDLASQNEVLKTMLTGYTYMYLSPSQLSCIFWTSFLNKLSLLPWSLEQAKKILECVSVAVSCRPYDG